MVRQYSKYLTMSAVAIALTTLLSACGGSNHHKSKPAPVVQHHSDHISLVTHHTMTLKRHPKVAPISNLTPKQGVVRYVKHVPSIPHAPMPNFSLPKNHYIFVVDATGGVIHSTGPKSYTLNLPLNNVAQVAEFIFTQHATPSYFLGKYAVHLWQTAPQNIFANEHAILSAKYNTPHAVLITGETLKNNNIVFEIESNKPINGYHLKNIVLNIRGQN